MFGPVPVAGEPVYKLQRDGAWWVTYYRKFGTTDWMYVDKSLRLTKFFARRFIKCKTECEFYDKYGQRTW